MALLPAAAAASRQSSPIAAAAICAPRPTACTLRPAPGFMRPSRLSSLAESAAATSVGGEGPEWRRGVVAPVRPRGPLRVRARSTSGAVREVNLVDPLTAKQLAEEDMGRRRVAARKQKFRDIEAVNGGWAVLGLTAAVVGESSTGEGVLGQLAVYLDMVAAFLEALEKQL